MNTPPRRLFAPGSGAAPPVLAGREREQETLSLCLSDLLGGRAPPHDVVLVGPRGNGKAAAARPTVARRVTEYYEHRYRELEAGGLLPAATAVASAFRGGRDAAADGEVDAVLAAAGLDAADRLAIRETLNRLGYVWRPPGQLPPVVWSPGIPSLMQHVLDRTAAASPAPDRGGSGAPFAR